jgi:hypothetical protein
MLLSKTIFSLIGIVFPQTRFPKYNRPFAMRIGSFYMVIEGGCGYTLQPSLAMYNKVPVV